MKTTKELRNALNMNLTRFSEFTGIPYRTLQNWEAGTNACPEYVLSMLNGLIEPYLEVRDYSYTWICVEDALCRGVQEETTFLTREAAEHFALIAWDHLTDREKKEQSVYIGKIKLMVEDDEVRTDWVDGLYLPEYMHD